MKSRLVKIEWQPDWDTAVATFQVNIPMDKNTIRLAENGRQKHMKQVLKELEKTASEDIKRYEKSTRNYEKLMRKTKKVKA